MFTVLLSAEVCVILCGSRASAQDESHGIAYTVEFSGLEETGLEKRLRELSETVRNRKDRPASIVHLRRRMQRDRETFQEALRAEGYYGARIEPEVKQDQAPYVARFNVRLGTRYTFDTATFEPKALQVVPAGVMPNPKDVGLEMGQPARAEAVLDAERRLIAWLRNRGYPFASIAEREAIVDRDLRTMDLRFVVDLGQRSDFGELRVSGLEKVKRRVVDLETPWKEGEPYEARQLDLYRKRLYDTRLFSVVRLEPVDEDTPSAEVPISLDVVERKHRTIAVGLNYYTDEGFGTLFEWQHRNLWGLGHRLTWEARVGEIRQEGKLTLTLERFRRRGQRLNLGIEGGRFAPDAFTSNRVALSAILERDLTDHLTGAAGIAFRFSEVEQLGETETFQFVSFPLELRWDRSNSELDPTRGFRLSGRVEPFLDFFGEPSRFLKMRLTGSYYQPLDRNDKWVLAARATAGSILGESKGDVPADERFYAGGGGSVRGYPFQTVGPLEGTEPTGGLSLFEASVELRARFTETFGMVAFIDGGSAFDANVPNFEEDILFGAGAGIRYFSPIGPFRFDVAFPLDKRDNVDDSFQIYLSIGQAF